MGGNMKPRSGATGKYKVRSHFYAPPPQFDGCFTSFYHLDLEVEDGGTVTDYLLPEWASMRFFCGDTPWAAVPGHKPISGARFGMTGPTSLPTQFRLGTSRCWGIGVFPLGWARYFDGEASAFANRVLDGSQHPAFAKFSSLEQVLCDSSVPIGQQVDAITDTMEKLARPCRVEDTIVRIHRALIDEELGSVADFAERSEVTLRSLERMCNRYFGFAPKLLMRRQRFIRSLTSFIAQRGSKWTDVMDDHYHDQAQFSREFREFMTMSPSEYAAIPHPFLDSFIEARIRMRGSAAQTLDQP
jgi:AraC-like DNA-binding protein